MKEFGIDISRHNGNGSFDIARAMSEGVKFAILKAGGGDAGLYQDAAFEKYYSQAKSMGLPVGAYWFSRATTVEDIIAEADYFLDLLKDKKFELPVYIDVENENQLEVGRDTLTELIMAFCDHMEGHGYWVGIYSSKYYFLTKMNDDQLQKYAHWVAQWNDELCYDGTCGMWQFGGEINHIRSNHVAGMVCDQNYMLEDYPALIKEAGLNGYAAPASPSKSIDEIAYEVLDGLWGNGNDRKNALRDAHIDPIAVQERVNYLDKRLDEVAYEIYIKGKWGNGAERRENMAKLGLDYDHVQKRISRNYSL